MMEGTNSDSGVGAIAGQWTVLIRLARMLPGLAYVFLITNFYAAWFFCFARQAYTILKLYSQRV